MKVTLFGTVALLMLPTIAIAADAGSGPTKGAASTNDAGAGPTPGAKPDNSTKEIKGMGAPGAAVTHSSTEGSSGQAAKTDNGPDTKQQPANAGNKKISP